LNISTNKNSIILDFFAGSGTTGHSVLELNKEDNGNRKFILCTNNENNICEEVTYQRINKVINGYTTPKGKYIEGLGGNLKYYKVEEKSSAM
jgi:adenine-specific DNA-methyltransferase